MHAESEDSPAATQAWPGLGRRRAAGMADTVLFAAVRHRAQDQSLRGRHCSAALRSDLRLRQSDAADIYLLWQLSVFGYRHALCLSLLGLGQDRLDLHRAVPVAWLSHGVCHGASAGPLAIGVATAGHAAVVDVIFDSGLRLDGHSQ